MTTLRNCHIHGSFRADYPESCPSCDLAEFEREDRAEAREANETYKRNNPGDYTCPNCLYITLKSGASRCPKCQGTVGADYWVRVRAGEKAKALADQERERTRKAEEAAEEARKRAIEAKAAAEWERRAPEREAAARAAAAREEQLQKDKMTKECVLVGFLMGPVGGGILLGLAGCVSCAQHAHEYNSLLPPFHLFNGLFYGALIGVVVGPLLGLAIAKLR